MNTHSQFTKERLEVARRARDRFHLLSRCITVGAILIGTLLLLALADYWLLLPVAARFVAAGVLALLAGFGLFKFSSAWRHPGNLKQAALEIEAGHPDLGCVVSTASEYLDGQRIPTQSYE